MSNEGVKLGRLTLLEKAKLLNTFDGEFFFCQKYLIEELTFIFYIIMQKNFLLF